MKNKEFTTKISISAIEECNNETKNLIKKAQEATQRAYAPYSRYQVGAAVLLSNGEIITESLFPTCVRAARASCL